MQPATLLFLNVMAHFAEIEQKTDPTGFTSDTHWIVKRVIVVDNGITTSNGALGDNDMHEDGETWCKTFFNGGEWKQTSYHSRFRNIYAGIGYRYDDVNDVFIQKQPYASWTLDSSYRWQAPVTEPALYQTFNTNHWDEENLSWYTITNPVDLEEDWIYKYWDPNTSTWVDQ